jgi:PTS system mannose-specific IID component
MAIKLDKSTRRSVMINSQWLQGSWNYERMQNIGWAVAMIPALKKLYPGKEEASAALKRHLEFFNTHPYVAAPILGVTLALEEERANGAEVDDAAIQGVKVGMMGPLAGIGDPVFWFTIRPILATIAASLAMSGSILGMLFFLIVWNVVRIAFLWYTQELGYKQGAAITNDMSALNKITKGASILGMFVLGVLIQRWVSVVFTATIAKTPLSEGAYIDWSSYKGGLTADNLREILTNVNSGVSMSPDKVFTLQDNLNQLIPGLAGLLVTFLCMWLLKKKVSPIVIIFGLFALGIIGRVLGFM